ncbi:hypothetical protein C3Y91_21455 [Rhizobium sp. UPM1133]|nr:hypothetical protein [Rhizobium ruizarguesonis]
MVRLILRSCKADRPYPALITEAIMWAKIAGVTHRPAGVGAHETSDLFGNKDTRATLSADVFVSVEA